MADNFRVLLDVRDLNIPSLKYVWISVSLKDNKNISDLKSLIVDKINLPANNLKLFVREGLILDEETTAVLREDDVVRVEYDDKSPSKEFHSKVKKHKKRRYDECSPKDISSNKKKHKINHDDVDNCESKQKNNIDGSGESSSVEAFSKMEKPKAVFNADEHRKKHSKKRFNEKSNNFSCDLITIETSNIDDETSAASSVFNQSKKTKLKKSSQIDGISSVLDKTSSAISDPDQSKKTKIKKSSQIDEISKAVDKTNRSNPQLGCSANKDKSAISKQVNSDFSKTQTEFNDRKSDSVLTNATPKKKRKRRRKRKDISPPEVIVTLDSSVTAVNEFTRSSMNPERKHVIYSSHNQYTGSFHKDDQINSNWDKQIFPSETYTKSNSMTNENNLSSAKVSTPVLEKGNKFLDCDASAIRSGHAAFSSGKESSEKHKTSLSKRGTSKDTKLVSETSVKNISKSLSYSTNFSTLSSVTYQSDSGAEISNNHNHSEAFQGSKVIDETTSKEVPKSFNDTTVTNYDVLPTLSCQPEVGTKIAYKILELDESYSPVVSEYREGIVKEISNQTDEMVIDLAKHIIKPGRLGKFELLKELEMPPPEIIREDRVSWNAIIEPKLLS